MKLLELFNSWYNQLTAAAEKAEGFKRGRPCDMGKHYFFNEERRKRLVTFSFNLLEAPTTENALEIIRFVDFSIFADKVLGTSICEVHFYKIQKALVVKNELVVLGHNSDWQLFRYTENGWIKTGCEYSTAVIVELYQDQNEGEY
jgi:hypothetical protein